MTGLCDIELPKSVKEAAAAEEKEGEEWCEVNGLVKVLGRPC